MKKKGLIISTVVMVVVLIASLTTATYAWFTASNVTELKGFDVSVISNNAVNIGVKTDYTHFIGAAGVSPSAFRTGTAEFTGATPGQINSGGWSGTEGLSATLDPQILWGAQSAAVGVTTQDVGVGATLEESEVTYWNGTSTYAVKGNKNGTNVDVTKATPNKNGERNGDYVHFILGVSPTKDLGTNNFVIVIEPSATGSSLGVLASIHVAYRITNYKRMTTGDWHDIDLYGDNRVSGSTYYTGNSLKTNVTSSPTNGGEIISPDSDLDKAYKETYGSTAAAPTGSIAYQITGLDMNKDEITQLEIVIYMAGSDPDCNDQGKTAAGSIKMFFNTQEKSTAPTAATVNAGNTFSFTGVNGAKVEYSTNNGTTWNVVSDGSWEGTKFTSSTISGLYDETKVLVRQTETGKAPSNAVTATKA